MHVVLLSGSPAARSRTEVLLDYVRAPSTTATWPGRSGSDRLGFGGVLIPTGRSCEDSWLVAASRIPVTQHLKFLAALHPGIISPTVAARQAMARPWRRGSRSMRSWASTPSSAPVTRTWRSRTGSPNCCSRIWT
ncbi:MAG: hypothetical protein DI559_05440 [Ectopseudomonas oleovorans]|nr:MAG: hypothetical protein DI559_05440 [Pseudomonas oleovorans]